MDILKAEIARKRKHIEEKELVDDSKTYFKRADLARKEEEEYYRRCGYKLDKTEEEAPPSTSSNPVLELELTEEKLPMTLSRQEVIRRLRERGEPIRLFGESDYDAFQRLRKIEFLAPEVNKALGASLGTGDDFRDMDVINKVLRFLLGVWAKDLNSREDHVKRSVQGKLASATQKQTESYLGPMFRKLRKKILPADIKESITDIIKFMLEREYVKGLKRLITICQKHFPTDPSKCVEYKAL
ncbi:hypothetical protein cypCar_00018294 [Cyprinus carpio]|nr:hypothetical protein cypCar_00018294 [Cyprinus carpio]